MEIFGSFSRLVSILFRKNGQDITVRPNQATTYTAARDVQLPPADSAQVLVGDTATQTLTNKTLTAPVISLPTGITKADVGLANVDNTSDATKNAATATLTNKTIDADLNFITNIEDADIKANAGIDASKIANGSVSNVEFQYLNGVSSDIQVQLTTNATGLSNHLADASDAHDASAISNVPAGNLAATDVQGALNELQSDVDTRATSASLSAHTGASSGVHGVTGSVVGTTDTQTLTNKLISSTSALTGALTLPLGTQAQRPTPSSGMVRLNTDSNEFEGYANGAWSSIGGGINEEPVRNYLKTYATAAVPAGTLATVAAGGNIATTAGLFYADTTSGAAALTQSSSTALRGSFNYLSAVSGAALAGTTFFQFPAFAVESSDLGKPLTLSFDVTSALVSGDWDVVVVRYNSSGTFQEILTVAGVASGATLPSARIPSGTANFSGFFVPSATAGDLYAVRARRLASTAQLRLDTLYVGPQSRISGQAVTDWQAYTPTTAGIGTINSNDSWWRRIGDSIELQVRFATGTVTASQVQIGLPTGFIVGSSLVSTQLFGRGAISRTTATTNKSFTLHSTTGLSYLNVGMDDNPSTNNPLTALNGSSIFNSAEVISFFARVPIVGWSSNVTMADRAVEEYAFNTSTSTTASDTTSFGNGPQGAAIQNITAQIDRRVRFQTPIQPTDAMILEVSVNGTQWAPAQAQGGASIVFNGTSGMGISNPGVNSTDVDVRFGGSGWSSISSYRWRVRKVSGGAAVGYPVSARNIVGDVSGTAVPSGYIGERPAEGAGSSTTVNTAVNLTSITLTPGNYLLFIQVNASTSGGTNDYLESLITTSSTPSVAGTQANDRVTAFAGVSGRASTNWMFPVNVTSTTTYYLHALTATSGSATTNGRIRPVRAA